MAISINDTKTYSGTSNGETLTPTFGNSNTGCIVGISVSSTTGGITAPTITCDSHNMTLAADAINTAGSNWNYTWIYYYIGSLLGAKNVVIGYSVSILHCSFALAVREIHQTTPLADHCSSITTNPSFTAADISGIILTCVANSNHTTPTNGVNYTSIITATYCDTAKRTSGISKTETLVWGSLDVPTIVGASFSPAPSGGQSVAISPFLIFMNRILWDKKNCLWQPKGLLNGI